MRLFCPSLDYIGAGPVLKLLGRENGAAALPKANAVAFALAEAGHDHLKCTRKYGSLLFIGLNIIKEGQKRRYELKSTVTISKEQQKCSNGVFGSLLNATEINGTRQTEFRTYSS